ncbi:MAG: hypothetical protein IPN79_13875 [Saprospiraceae bacterium]|nr:hypothetical protein [Saprospiraceae bacterium]
MQHMWVDHDGLLCPGFTLTLEGTPDDDGLCLPKLLKSKYWNPFSLAPVQVGVKQRK